MATLERRNPDAPIQPAGTEGEGMEAYPTYRDGPTARDGSSGAGQRESQRGSGAKPTDTNLPQRRRTFASPMLIGLIAFAAILLIAIFGGLFNLAESTDAVSQGEANSAAATTGSSGAPAATLDQDGTAASATGPGEVQATPGVVDVPGGATTTPAQPAPAQ